ncbi:TonB-dependent receptor [Marivirga atlantica]|uniref:TonB-dependent receptor n=1 Tax=Marivirga atlantica TaxID=1548457 RepID=A0A937DFJ3_9BACT|nr:TonB-dependent receptor [Marivirga atlantica]MBL0766277.1 TonB-dependent receptor [Marivirga atlantica]
MLKQILLILLLFPFGVSAQNDNCDRVISGTIYNLSTDEPLPFSTVQVQGTSKGVVSDENGKFILKGLCEEEFDLIFSHVGYKKLVHHHDVHHELPTIYMAPNEVTLESVVVEAERTTGDLSTSAVGKLSAKEYERESSRSFGDVVKNISGVTVLQTGQNVVKPVIHGLHSSRILIINNGVQHQYQNWGADHAPEIDPSLYDQIKVIKGASTVRYGAGALGGVLLIDADQPELLQDWNGKVGTDFSTNGRAFNTEAKLEKGYKNFAFTGQASYLKQGDLTAPNYQLTNTGKEELSASLAARYHRKAFDLNLYLSHFEQELGILKASVNGNLEDLANAMESEVPPETKPFSYEINNPRQVISHNMAKLHGTWHGEDQKVELQYAYQQNNRKEYDVRRGTNNEVPSIDLSLTSQTLNLDWKHPEIFNFLGSAGFQSIYRNNRNIFGTNTIQFVPNYTSYEFGAYLIESTELTPSTELEIGGRFDYFYSDIIGRDNSNDLYFNELNYSSFSATAGIKKQIQKGRIFRVNVGNAWRPANVSDFYRSGKHQSVIEYGLWRYVRDSDNNFDDAVLSNEERYVGIEQAFKIVSGYELKNDRFSAELTAYVNYIQNYIYSKPGGIVNTVRGAFPLFIYQQTDALFAGADISSKIQHSKQFSSVIRANYVWAKDITNDDLFVDIPPAHLGYGINYTIPNWAGLSGIELGLQANYYAEQFNAPRVITVKEILAAQEADVNLFAEDDSNFDYLPAPDDYLLMSLNAAADYKNFSFMAKVDNLLNTAYRSYTNRMRYFADETGINLSLSVKYKF